MEFHPCLWARLGAASFPFFPPFRGVRTTLIIIVITRVFVRVCAVQSRFLSKPRVKHLFVQTFYWHVDGTTLRKLAAK